MIYLLGLLLFQYVTWLAASDIEGDHLVVEAVAGGRASIPCNLSIPLEADEATLILWYRLDLPNPIYTLDVRNVDISNARHFPSEDTIGGRAYFDVSVHPPLLLLSDVVIDDEAIYKCRVDLRRSRTLILHSKLKVIKPPSEPIIMDEHGQRLHDVIGPYDEGSSITFVCEVDGGDPLPNVTWWRGTVLFDDSFNVIRKRFVRNELVIRNIQRSDWMMDYTCKASNTLLAKPQTASVQLDINLLPTQAKILQPAVVLLAGVVHEFTCETRGSRPRALTSWWLDGLKMTFGTSEVTREGGNVTYTTLVYTPTPEDNGKKLVCKAANPSMPKLTLEDERVLRVQYLPIVKLSQALPLSQSGIREGNDVHLECTIWANPWIFEVAWHFEDRQLLTNPGRGILVNNQSLILRKVTKDHRGRYRCLGTSVLGHGYSNYLRLQVQFAPVCKSLKPKVFGIASTERTTVKCETDADPPDLSYRWSLQDPSSGSTFLLSNWSREDSLLFSPQQGYGILLCWAMNSIGQQREPCVIRVVPAGAPDSPHDCVLTNHTSQSLTVECVAGYNGSLQQSFHMEVYDSVVEHMSANVTRVDKPKFRVQGLFPSTSYVLVIYASNTKGRSNSVALVVATLSAADKHTGNGDRLPLSQAIGILIGAIILLIILAVAVVVIFIKSRISKDHNSKDTVLVDTSIECDAPKKEESPEGTSTKGPDIIPLSIDPDVFFTGRITDDTAYSIKASPAEKMYVRQKYTDTVL